MSAGASESHRDRRRAVAELRDRLGAFSFRPGDGSGFRGGLTPGLRVRAGGIVEWLGAPGAGSFSCALQLGPACRDADGITAIVDSARECYAPALSGWGIDLGRTLLVRPSDGAETCWAIEQCLRCTGVSATWAWVDRRFSPRVHRRWQLAAEAGGGMGIIFRPESARREPVWADLRLLVGPRAGGPGEIRRIRIDVLYHRGGLGGTAQVWEIDHAEGAVCLVPEVADPAAAG